ncbi:MAG TPA: hypothetical protein VNG29_03290 [Candidatus Paceibacterota bacterium]|nr:hypothetical protein [Candidatus Paceibacterota bacterium]
MAFSPEQPEVQKPPQSRAEQIFRTNEGVERNLAQEREDAAKKRLTEKNKIRADFAQFVKKGPAEVKKEERMNSLDEMNKKVQEGDRKINKSLGK